MVRRFSSAQNTMGQVDEDPPLWKRGKVYVFTRRRISWSEKANLYADDWNDADDGIIFGAFVDICGDVAVIKSREADCEDDDEGRVLSSLAMGRAGIDALSSTLITVVPRTGSDLTSPSTVMPTRSSSAPGMMIKRERRPGAHLFRVR